jgi:hypothetical protein
MLRTKITFRDGVTDVAEAEAAFPRGNSPF